MKISKESPGWGVVLPGIVFHYSLDFLVYSVCQTMSSSAYLFEREKNFIGSSLEAFQKNIEIFICFLNIVL